MLDVQPTTLGWSHSANGNIPHEILASLQHHPLFQRSASREFLEEVACSMTLRTFAPRDIIIVKGEPAKAMFFLFRGTVDVCSADFERIYASLEERGQCFGEIGILYSIPRTATVVARTKCTVAALTAEKVAALLPKYPDIEQQLRFEAQERLAVLNKYNDEAGRHFGMFTSTSARELLQRVPFFENCPQEFLHQVSLLIQPKTYPPNTTLVRKGDIGFELFFIVDGTVEVTTDRDSDNAAVARLGSGDFFGEIAILLDVPRTANIRSITPLKVLVLNRSDFLDACNKYPQLAAHFKSMADKAYQMYKAQDAKITTSTVKRPQDTITEGAATFVPATDQHYGEPLSPIEANSVCSTTSDQDPTLPATVRTLRTNETRPRRPSIAVWSDPSLLSVSTESNKARRRSSQQTLSLMLVDKQNKSTAADRLSSLDCKLFQRIASYLDFASKMQLAACSKTLESIVRNDAEILGTVDLSYYNRRITDDTIEMIVEDIIGSHVRSLSLSHCYYVTDKGMAIIAEQCPQLEALDLNSCWLITDVSLCKLGQHCLRLTSINLSNCRKFTDAGISTFLQQKSLQSSLGLTELALSYCKNITNKTMHALAEYCSKTLSFLNIQRCTKVTDDAFEDWAITGFPALRQLVLTDCSFLTDKAIAMLVKAAPNLEHLRINFCCALSDSAVEDLSMLERLRALDVSFCGAAVSDASVAVLLKARANTLKSLNLRGCMRISGVGLMTAIEPVASLQLLNVSQCPGISAQVLSCLSRSPHVQNLVA